MPLLCPFLFFKKKLLYICAPMLMSVSAPLSDQFPFSSYVSSYLITYTVIVDDAVSLCSLSLWLVVYHWPYILVPHIPFVTQGSAFPLGTHPTPPFLPLVPFFLFLAIVDKVDIVGSLSQCVSPADHFFSGNEKKVDCVVPQVINSPDSDRLHKPQHKSFSSQPTRPTVVHMYRIRQ